MTHSSNWTALAQKAGLPEDALSRANITWTALEDIRNAFLQDRGEFEDAGEDVLRRLQRARAVHSVRMRVKDPDHLLAKIVRKRCEPDCSAKWRTIDPSNYREVATDLIGIRALHLMKEGLLEIDEFIRAQWDTSLETPVFYHRTGDVLPANDPRFTYKAHSAGYRSVHYLGVTSPTRKKFIFELQVRTLFEEAWSEIDHRARYPNFTQLRILSDCLLIFNRLAGSADELGSFVMDLRRRLTEAEEKYAADLKAATEQAAELEELNAENAQVKQQVSSLRSEIAALRHQNVYHVLGGGLKGTQDVGQLLSFGRAGEIDAASFFSSPAGSNEGLSALAGSIPASLLVTTDYSSLLTPQTRGLIDFSLPEDPVYRVQSASHQSSPITAPDPVTTPDPVTPPDSVSSGRQKRNTKKR